jgi:hypothetical protein
MGGKSSAPPPPDLTAIAKQQASDQQALLDKQTLENRVNQVGADGSSLTWSKDPTSGVWTQTTKLSDTAQQAQDAQTRIDAGLSSTAEGLIGSAQSAVSQPFNYDGMTDVSGYDTSKVQDWGAVPGQGNVGWAQTDTGGMTDYGSYDPSKLSDYGNLDYSKLGAMPDSGFGAVDEVQKAMMGRLQGGLDQGRSAEIQRLKSQGITEGTPAWQAAMQSLNQKDVDANQQSLLGATSAYNDIFNRGMQARQEGVSEADKQAAYANSLRAQQFGEQGTMANYADQQRSQQLAERMGLTSEQNNLNQSQFNQQAAQSAYANSLRGMQMGEQGTLRDASTQDRNRQIEEAMRLRQNPLNELNAFRSGSQIANPTFSSYNTAGQGQAADVYGAAKDDYTNAMNAYNAQQAQSGGMMSGLLGAAGGIAGAYFGGPLGAKLGSSLGGSLGGAMG